MNAFTYLNVVSPFKTAFEREEKAQSLARYLVIKSFSERFDDAPRC